MAVDGFGREIVVLAPQQLDPADFQSFTSSGMYDVWLEYQQQLASCGYQGELLETGKMAYKNLNLLRC